MNLVEILKEYTKLMQIAASTSDQDLYNKVKEVVIVITDQILPKSEGFSNEGDKEVLEEASVVE